MPSFESCLITAGIIIGILVGVHQVLFDQPLFPILHKWFARLTHKTNKSDTPLPEDPNPATPRSPDPILVFVRRRLRDRANRKWIVILIILFGVFFYILYGIIFPPLVVWTFVVEGGQFVTPKVIKPGEEITISPNDKLILSLGNALGTPTLASGFSCSWVAAAGKIQPADKCDKVIYIPPKKDFDVIQVTISGSSIAPPQGSFKVIVH